MPIVFTYFNHGTAAHRDGEGEIVAEFGLGEASQVVWYLGRQHTSSLTEMGLY